MAQIHQYCRPYLQHIYHAIFGCESSRVFHQRIPYKVLDFEMGIRPQKIATANSQVAEDVLEQTELIFQDVCKNALPAYIKYKA